MAKNLVNRSTDVLPDAKISSGDFANFTGFPDNMQTNQYGNYDQLGATDGTGNFTKDMWTMLQNRSIKEQPLELKEITIQPVVTKMNSYTRVVKTPPQVVQKVKEVVTKETIVKDPSKYSLMPLALMTILIAGITAAVVK